MILLSSLLKEKGWKVDSRYLEKTHALLRSDLYHESLRSLIGTFLFVGFFKYFVAFHKEKYINTIIKKKYIHMSRLFIYLLLIIAQQDNNLINESVMGVHYREKSNNKSLIILV